jgi:hypothetical protein
MTDLYPLVEMAVVLITDEEGRFLVEYKEAWGGFSFPCTKLRELGPAVAEGPMTKETPHAAASRAVAEVLGVPIDPNTLAPLPHEVPRPRRQGNRDPRRHRRTPCRGVSQ